MVMSWHPDRPGKAPDPPAYSGPTTAERFTDDVAAYRSLGRLGLERPAEIELGAIMRRYPAAAASNDSEGMLERLTFLDGSAAKKNRRGRWVVN